MLTIDLHSEAEHRLRAEAEVLGVPPEELAARLLNDVLAANSAEDKTEAARLAAINEAFGFAADVNFSVEDLHRQRREEQAREEAKFQRQFGGEATK